MSAPARTTPERRDADGIRWGRVRDGAVAPDAAGEKTRGISTTEADAMSAAFSASETYPTYRIFGWSGTSST